MLYIYICILDLFGYTKIVLVQGGPLLVVNGVISTLYMAKNKWVSLGLFHPTYRGLIPPCITMVGAHLVMKHIIFGILGTLSMDYTPIYVGCNSWKRVKTQLTNYSY